MATLIGAAGASRRLVFTAALAGLAGCTLTPEGTREERSRLESAGEPYEPRVEERVLPELPAEPGWRDVLHRAFLANGNLEAAYFRWKAAVERIDIAGAYPNSDVTLGFSYAFSSGRMNSFDRTTFSVGFDSMKNLAFPGKTEQAAKVALDEARAAGQAFRVAKFDLQRRVLNAWSDYALQARTVALRREDLALRRMLEETGTARAVAGDRRRDILMADLGLRTAESQLRDLESERDSTRATLNALMAREPDATIQAPPEREPAREIPSDDRALLEAAADMFPEVAVLNHEVTARRDALELARLRWIPDINPSLVFTGSIMQALGAAIVLPTTIAEIRGRVREAEAQLRETEGLLRQRRADRIGEYVSLVIALRNAQRREALFRYSIVPAVERIADDQARAFEAAGATFADLIESRRALLDARLVIAQARAQIDRAIVEIECCLGADIETFAGTAPERNDHIGIGTHAPIAAESHGHE